MIRIKTYVMTVGVALSVAPIFNYAFAQQGNSATQLLLQVQTMRQEIAELRDMIDRQQFQLKRLQKQSDAQSKQLELVQGLGNRVSGDSNSPGYSTPALPADGSNFQAEGSWSQAESSRSQADGSRSQADGSRSQAEGSGPQGVANANSVPAIADVNAIVDARQQTESGLNQPQSVEEVYRSNAPVTVSAANQNAYSSPAPAQQAGQVIVEERQIGQATSESSNYPPVVDRSFSTTTTAVPVTGAGTRSSGPSDGAATVQQVFAQEREAQFNQLPQVTTTAPSTTAPETGGVISIPAQVGTLASQNQNQSPIDASQPLIAPVPESVPASNAQFASAQTVPIQATVTAKAVLSEDDYYSQGFELLKQSKYEEAASIFDQQLEAYPRGDLADDAHYWIAEAMHVSRKLDVAKVHLKAIINDYPQSRRLPDAMLKTAYIEQSQGNQIEARILFQEIVNLHPQSDAAIAAKNQLSAVN